jgi:hypothetical protein
MLSRALQAAGDRFEPDYRRPAGAVTRSGWRRLPRIYFLQQWFDLSDAAKDAIYDSELMHRFAGIALGEDKVPDETKILRSRRLADPTAAWLLVCSRQRPAARHNPCRIAEQVGTSCGKSNESARLVSVLLTCRVTRAATNPRRVRRRRRSPFGPRLRRRFARLPTPGRWLVPRSATPGQRIPMETSHYGATSAWPGRRIHRQPLLGFGGSSPKDRKPAPDSTSTFP